MAAGMLVALALPAAREFFALEIPRPLLLLAGVGAAALSGLALEAGWRAAGWLHRRPEQEE
jgi:cation-transporting ATPase E